MHDIKDKRQRRKRKLRRIFWHRCMAGVLGVLLLMGVWKATSFALRQLSPQPEQEEIESETVKVSKTAKAEANPLPKTESVGLGKSAAKILLVNKSHPLEEDYRPVLKKLTDYGVEVDASIYEALNRMLKAGEREGLSFWIASAYRSPQRQRELLDEDIEELVRQGYSYSEAYEEVVKETMPVGCSEHASGLAVDIVAKDYQMLDEKQGRTEESKWLQQNCSQYGFILRYPEGKEDITEVSYESWHFRYVGVDAAKEIMRQGVTLEEYLESE